MVAGGEGGFVAAFEGFEFFLVLVGFEGGVDEFVAGFLGLCFAEVSHDFDVGDAGGFEAVPDLLGVIFHGSALGGEAAVEVDGA